MKAARWPGAALACAVLISLTACGGGGGTTTTPATQASPSPPAPQAVTPAVYVRAMCTAMVDLQATVFQSAEQLQGTISSDDPPEQRLEVARTFLENTIVASEALILQLQVAGVPEGSEEFANGVREGAESMKSSLEGALAELDQVPLDDEAAFDSAMQSLGDRLNEAISQAFQPLSDLQDPALDEAFAAEPACAQLRGTA
jgi:hypothetical protein